MAPTHVEYVDFVGWDEYRYDMRVEFTSDRSGVTKLVVQLEVTIGDDVLPIVRYDTHHGRFHRDTLDLAGQQIRKEWLDDRFLTLSDALEFAKADTEEKWRVYGSAFFRRPRRIRDMAVEYSTKPSEWRVVDLPVSREMSFKASLDFDKDIIQNPDLVDLFPRSAVLKFAPRGIVSDPPPDFSTPRVDVWILGISPPSPAMAAHSRKVFDDES